MVFNPWNWQNWTHLKVGFKSFRNDIFVVNIPDHDSRALGEPFHIKPLNGVKGQIEQIAKLVGTGKS